jgi:hypothetical protein
MECNRIRAQAGAISVPPQAQPEFNVFSKPVTLLVEAPGG